MPTIIKEFKGKYAFLSNMYDFRKFGTINDTINGFKFFTSEHAYQCMKTPILLEKKLIAEAVDGAEAKRLGNNVTLVPNWGKIKIQIMEQVIRAKFSIPELKKMLLNTEDAELEEGNHWYDYYWGKDLKTGKGKNNLGKILMKEREFAMKKPII